MTNEYAIILCYLAQQGNETRHLKHGLTFAIMQMEPQNTNTDTTLTFGVFPNSFKKLERMNNEAIFCTSQNQK